MSMKKLSNVKLYAEEDQYEGVMHFDHKRTVTATEFSSKNVYEFSKGEKVKVLGEFDNIDKHGATFKQLIVANDVTVYSIFEGHVTRFVEKPEINVGDFIMIDWAYGGELDMRVVEEGGSFFLRSLKGEEVAFRGYNGKKQTLKGLMEDIKSSSVVNHFEIKRRKNALVEIVETKKETLEEGDFVEIEWETMGTKLYEAKSENSGYALKGVINTNDDVFGTEMSLGRLLEKLKNGTVPKYRIIKKEDVKLKIKNNGEEEVYF